MYHTVTLPCLFCDGEIDVEIKATEGEKAVMYPNDKAHPGSPPEVEILGEDGRFACECEYSDSDWRRLEEENHDRLLEEAGEAMLAAEEYHQEREMERRMEERYFEKQDGDSLGKY